MNANRPRSSPPWFVDELAFAGRENRDPDHVAHYDAKEDASSASEVALLKELGLSERSLVVEFGPGTGQFTLEVAPECERVIAVDVSSPMLQRLEEKKTENGLANVAVVRAGFLTYEHESRPADFVYSRLALHHLPDFWKAVALHRVRQMMRPGSILRLWDVVYDFGSAEAEDRIEAWCAKYGERAEDEWGRKDVEEHVRDEHSTFSWLLEPIIHQSGFKVRAVERSEDGVLSKYILEAG